ncbi:type 2 lantipeptide synthetase LanM [Amycolatopsis panacis]|uniref:Type 2 lantipeptide synthetase LanM n=1 Tax=Amycolatopsis panacis TaxID=2340917 RepID=A0A419I828_9PSEU|nr:type 2 lantipeptide synthetase LanM [Amycolatopsis panacis]
MPGDGAEPDPGEMRRWQDSAYLDEKTFHRRLSAAGHTAESFATLITAVSYRAADTVPDWPGELRAALAAKPFSRDEPRKTRLYGETYDELLFAGVVRPISDHYAERLAVELRRSPLKHSCAPTVLGALAVDLDDLLVTVVHRPLITEVHRFREVGLLRGATSRDRYLDYDTRILADPGYLAGLWRRYPVLGRMLVEAGRTWVESSRETLRRFDQDHVLLRETELLPVDAGPLVAIRPGLGDRHHHGRTASLLEFQDGTRLVYKPRPVEPEQLYARAVEVLNGLTGSGLRAAKVLARPGYGWCEHVARKDAAEPAALDRFYHRLGAVLAVLHVFGTTDLHTGNLIAAADQPVPIDLETVFQPPDTPGPEATGAYDRAVDLLGRSVLATAMLPQRAFGDGVSPGADFSAIGGGGRCRSARPLPWLTGAFTDEPAIEARHRELGESSGRPTVAGVPATPGPHAPAILSGFTEAYDAIAAHRDVFAALVGEFASTPIRVVLRNTRRYDLFLYEARHPRYLRDGKDQDELLDKLWTAVRDRPSLAPVVESERRQLLAGDIPSFTCRADSRHLRAENTVVAPDYWAEPPIRHVERTLAGLGGTHRAVQLQIIADSLSALPGCPPALGETVPSAGGTSVAELAEAGLDHLAEGALTGRDDVTWIGIGLDGAADESLTFKPLSTSLYDGLAGMALVYTHAAALTGSARHADLGRRALQPVLAELTRFAESGGSLPLGAYAGLAGALYTVDQVGRCTADDAHRVLVAAVAGRLHDAVRTTTSPDLISGVAGCLAVTAALETRTETEQATLAKLAAACVERLGELAVPAGGGVGWAPRPGDPLLGGFSHGSAGIGWALLRAGARFDDPSATELGLRGLTYDASLRIPGRPVWRDLRDFPDNTGSGQRHPTLWCHGATGIGISRLLAYRITGEQRFREEAAAAVTAVAEAGALPGQSLCHGTAGSIEFLTLAAQVLDGDPAADLAARHRALLLSGLCTGIRAEGFTFGKVSGTNVPGLMMGKAGVCLTLLRAAWPGRVPSPLWLAEGAARPAAPTPAESCEGSLHSLRDREGTLHSLFREPRRGRGPRPKEVR